MRYVVTGGAGFIGATLVSRLVDAGHEVLVIDDLSHGQRRSPATDRAQLEQIDISTGLVSQVVADAHPDVVIHAAAQVSVPRSVEDPERDRAVNVVGTTNVLEGAASVNARLVFLSSGGAIYGNADGATEDDEPKPMSPYGAHKLEAERVIIASGLPYAIARLANVYGPGQRADAEGGVVATFIRVVRSGSPVELHGGGHQTRDFVHVADVVEALVTMAEANASGVWNVGTGQSVAIRDLAEAIVRISGMRVPLVEGPAREGDVRDSRLAIARIQRQLGWRPKVSLEAGLTGLLARPPAS